MADDCSNEHTSVLVISFLMQNALETAIYFTLSYYSFLFLLILFLVSLLRGAFVVDERFVTFEEVIQVQIFPPLRPIPLAV